MIKKRRTYLPRIIGDKVIMPADLKRLHKYMLEIEHISLISDEVRRSRRGMARACAQAAAEGAALTCSLRIRCPERRWVQQRRSGTFIRVVAAARSIACRLIG
jgi:hypothetical protein